MCKKFALAALLVAAGLVAYKKFDIKVCRKNNSPEARIERVEKALEKTTTEFRQMLDKVAVMKQSVRAQETAIKDVEACQAVNRKELRAQDDLVRAEASLVKDGSKPSARQTEAEEALRRLVTTYESCDNQLRDNKRKLAADRKALDAALAEVDAYQSEVRNLEVELAKLKADLAQVRAEETKSKIHFNKTELSKLKKEAAEIRKDVEVRGIKLELEGQYLGREKKAETKKQDGDVLKRAEAILRVEH
jgi:chromosome segregation ATPase